LNIRCFSFGVFLYFNIFAIFNQKVLKNKEFTEGRKWQKFCSKVIGVSKNGQK
jgi:cytochrome c biogenesis protein CcdA